MTDTSIPQKQCSKCRIEKPVSEFRNESKTKDGLSCQCKNCRYITERAWREKNRERERATAAIRREKNRDSVNERNRERYANNESVRTRAKNYRERNKERQHELKKRWYDANADYAREYSRKWRAEHIERAREASREYYWNNRTAFLAKSKVYRQRWEKQNPDKVRAKNHRRRALRISAIGNHTADDVQVQYQSQKGLCWWCEKPLDPKKYHVDHRVALTRGGTNSPNNLCITCPTCNSSKGAKLPHEWGDRLL